MQNSSFHLPFSSSINIKDEIFRKMQQSKAILTCVMHTIELVGNDMNLDNTTIYHALCTVDDYLEELGLLFERLRS